MPSSKTTERDRYLRKRYGITEAMYQALLEAWSGCCWICGRPPKGRRLHVEHDHKTGLVRGLTDWRCNAMLERALDDPTTLRRAADYLESTEAVDIIERMKDA